MRGERTTIYHRTLMTIHLSCVPSFLLSSFKFSASANHFSKLSEDLGESMASESQSHRRVLYDSSNQSSLYADRTILHALALVFVSNESITSLNARMDRLS